MTKQKIFTRMINYYICVCVYILFVTYIIVRHFFLAQGGVDTQVLIKELGTVHLGPSTEHRQAILDTDIEGYLEQQHTETVMKLIQDGRQQIMDGIHQKHTNDIQSTWKTIHNELSKKIPEPTKKINLSKAKFNRSQIVSAGIWTTE
ncbi:hypothetical protein RMATCC62417_07452 [Rhizopus microsporus]|nr:hypothetical protein RMATCC62417_07452 [Rhizopus microsporus]